MNLFRLPEVLPNEEIFEALNQPIVPTYFKGLSQEGLLDLTSLDFEKKSIEERVMENLEFGFPNEITENLNNFLKMFHLLIFQKS